MRAVGRLRFYLRYSTRSLRRGGIRTTMAVLCIAVGVMSVVSLRLVADTITVSLTGDVRTANGGDISLQTRGLPLSPTAVAGLQALQSNGTATRVIALGTTSAAVRTATGQNGRLSPLYVLDTPSDYPLVGDGGFTAPSGMTFGSALSAPRTIVITQFIADELNTHVGATLHLTVIGGDGTDVRVTGIVADTLTIQGSGIGYINRATYAAIDKSALSYGTVYMTLPARTDAAALATRLRGDYPQATVQTVSEALDQGVTASQQVTQFLLIVGLLALLIGGIGIINTITVLLSRRRVEIAMLRTTGYRRRDLYALFGLETAMLGIIGGVIGSGVGILIADGVTVLVERVITIPLLFHVDAGIVASGLAIGIATSLIFGLLPIVRACAVRPAVVLRDEPGGRSVASRGASLALYTLDAALYAALAAVLLQDVQLAIIMVVATAIALGILTLVFGGIAALIARLPIPERMTLRHFTLVLCGVLAAALLTVAFPGPGACLLALTVGGWIVVLLPRRPKMMVRQAMRSVGRARTRTAATLVALFVGVFSVGLIIIVGSDISQKLDATVSTLTDYSVIAVAPASDGANVRSIVARLPGLQAARTTVDLTVTATKVDGVDIATRLNASTGGSQLRNQFRLSGLTGVEGYGLASKQFPETTASHGRVLTPADAGTANVMLPDGLRGRPLNLHAGDVVTLESPTTHATIAVTVVGFYSQVAVTADGVKIKAIYQPILADAGIISRLGSGDASSVIALRFDPQAKDASLRALEAADPNVSIFDFADLATLAQDFLRNIIVLLVAIASLSLFAGIVIIANTVALAMLERRRELGILKATGYTGRAVLLQILAEYAIIGCVAATAGMLAVSIATVPLGNDVLHIDLAVPISVVLGIVVAVGAVCAAVAFLVALRPSRLRPVEVLRYE